MTEVSREGFKHRTGWRRGILGVVVPATLMVALMPAGAVAAASTDVGVRVQARLAPRTGDVLVYLVKVTNHGPTASNASVTASLDSPPYATGITKHGACSAFISATNKVSCNLGTLNVDETVLVKVHVPQHVHGARTLTATATSTGSDTYAPE